MSLVLASLLIVACAVNPVTGQSELMLISPAQELEIGRQNYAPSQQAQGGRYVVDPNLSAYVNEIGQKLAHASKNPQLPFEFVVLNNDVPNAWALPGGKIAINRGLLLYLKDESQLAAVLSHEITHAVARHGAQQMTRGMLLSIGTQVVGQASQSSGYGDLILAGTGITAAAWQARYGREQELQADRYGMDIMSAVGYDPQGAVELQQTFVELSKNQNNKDWLSGLFASHPPSEERVRANRQHAAQLSGSVRNEAAFQRAVAQLRHDQKAYQQYEQAIAALKDKNYDKALSLVNAAIKIQPEENQFWETKAHILAQQKGDRQQALEAYTRAIELNPEYFSPYLGRGSLNYDMGNYAAAERDLLSSQKLLDTQVTNYLLAEVSMTQGKTDAAVNYYRKVVNSGGELGQAAQQRLDQMGASRQP